MSVSSPPILKLLSDLDIDLMDVNDDVDYLRALMEATNALVITNASDRRIPVLQKEIKRVRADRKKADPKFKVKKTTVSPQKIMGQIKNSTGIGQLQKMTFQALIIIFILTE